MPSLNKVILIGHLTADPELRQTQAGVPVCSFVIGIQRSHKDSEGKNNSDNIDVIAWRKQAEFIAASFTKSRPICVFGSLRQRSWLDKDGKICSVMEVTADDVSFVDSPANNTQPDSDRIEH